jgi:hypothetical protein
VAAVAAVIKISVVVLAVAVAVDLPSWRRHLRCVSKSPQPTRRKRVLMKAATITDVL